jgi:hypothetical protein
MNERGTGEFIRFPDIDDGDTLTVRYASFQLVGIYPRHNVALGAAISEEISQQLHFSASR